MFLLFPAGTQLSQSKLNKQKCYKTTRTAWSLNIALRFIAEAKGTPWAWEGRPAKMENASLDFRVHLELNWGFFVYPEQRYPSLIYLKIEQLLNAMFYVGTK